MFPRVLDKVEKSGGYDNSDFVVLSRDLSPWRAEHLFATPKPLAGEEQVTLGGDFVTKAFEGPYSQMGQWFKDMQALAAMQGARWRWLDCGRRSSSPLAPPDASAKVRAKGARP